MAAITGIARTIDVDLTVNGKLVSRTVDKRTSLMRFLRDDLGLVGTKDGCGTGDCGSCVVLVDGQLTSPWKVLAAAECAETMKPAQVVVAAAVCTQPVQDRLRARRLELVCPTVVMDPNGHPNPFGDPQDASAERLKSIVIARHAA